MHAPIINIAISAALAAEKIIIRAMKRLDTIQVFEKKPNDFVTEVDQRVEKEIIAVIHKACPTHGIIGEESEEIKGDDYQWIIDPIDGTRNFIHGFPYLAVSIGIMYKNKIEHGVIYDPIRHELFTASRGKGAKLNDRRIRIGARKTLASALLSTCFSHPHGNRANASQIMQILTPLCGDLRHTGSAALDLAYIAAGRLDGFCGVGLKLWDMAAGILLVKEAGGMICDHESGESYLETGNIVAANPVIMRQLLKAIKLKN